MRVWAYAHVLLLGALCLSGCMESALQSDEPIPAGGIPAPPSDVAFTPDEGLNREVGPGGISISDIDGRSVETLTEVGDVVCLAGDITEAARQRFGEQGKLYVLSRRISVGGSHPWYVHDGAISTSDVRDRWRMAHVPLGRHGPAGTYVEVRAVIAESLPLGFFLPDPVSASSTLVSASVKVRLGHLHRPSATITRVANKHPQVGAVIPVLRQASVEARVRDIPSRGFIYSVVQPTETGRRWVNGGGIRHGIRWNGIAYLGRGRGEPQTWATAGARTRDTRDDNKWFWVSVVVTTRELRTLPPDVRNDGISPDTWRERVEPYIVTSSQVVKVFRTKEWGDPIIQITQIGGAPVEPGGLGSPGRGPLEVERYGPVQGIIDPNGAPDVTRDLVWLLSRPIDDTTNTAWQVLGGPWPVRAGNYWGRPAVFLASRADCQARGKWVCVAGLALPNVTFSSPVTETRLNSFLAFSPEVTIRPVEH